MTGIEMKNKPCFDAAEKFLRDFGVRDVVNPANKPTEILERDATPEEYREYIREDIFDLLFDVWWLPSCIKRLLLRRGGVTHLVLLPGWPESNGATLEVDIATVCGILVGELPVDYNKPAWERRKP
jgi:hypothetical protein